MGLVLLAANRTRRTPQVHRSDVVSAFDFAPMGDQLDHREDRTAGQRLNMEIGRLRGRESQLEAQVETLEIVISRLRSICDAAYTFVREDSYTVTAWQALVSALDDTRYEPRP